MTEQFDIDQQPQNVPVFLAWEREGETVISCGLNRAASALAAHLMERGVMPENSGWREVTESEAQALTAPSEEEAAAQLAAEIRAERDRRIAATDYLLMPDYTLDDATRATYVKAGIAGAAHAAAKVSGGGIIESSMNVASVTRTATGTLEVRFIRPARSIHYAILLGCGGTVSSTGGTIEYSENTTEGFTIYTKKGQVFSLISPSVSPASNSTSSWAAYQLANLTRTSPPGCPSTWW